jgi:hypothetical protein
MMHTRRFTRLTNAKEGRKSCAFRRAVRDILQFLHIHKTLRTMPAIAAGVTERLWEIGDIVDVLEAREAIQ